MFWCKRWTSTKFNNGNFGFTQTCKNNTTVHVPSKRNMTPLFWVDLTFESYEDDMVFGVFIIFLFRTNGKKGHLGENDLRHCYGNFFRKLYSESYLITAMFKVPSKQLRATLTTAFWKIPYSFIIYGHGSTCMLNVSSSLR